MNRNLFIYIISISTLISCIIFIIFGSFQFRNNSYNMNKYTKTTARVIDYSSTLNEFNNRYFVTLNIEFEVDYQTIYTWSDPISKRTKQEVIDYYDSLDKNGIKIIYRKSNIKRIHILHDDKKVRNLWLGWVIIIFVLISNFLICCISSILMIIL